MVVVVIVNIITSMIIEPTLALIRAQLGFRIQVRAECGNNLKPGDTHQTPSRHFPDTPQKHSRHPPNFSFLAYIEVSETRIDVGRRLKGL